MNLKIKALNTLAISVSCATAVQAACMTDEQVSVLAGHYAAKTPADNIEGLNDTDGACTRTKFNAILAKQFGKVIGYKAGLTNPAVQKRFNTDKPVWGKLYEGMLLQSGVTLDAAFGARPLYEADLLVRVKSAGINQAKTPLEVLATIDQIIPFIEHPKPAGGPGVLQGTGG
jgi:2-keto-4-pentenoate hydratase